MPLRYGSERDEHLAVRTRAGLFDLSHMGEITVTGPQAAALLNHALVGNIASVGVGRARYTMICREDGGILDDLIVYRLAENEYMVVANASNAQVVLDALAERAAGFDALVRDDRDAYALIAVQGPSPRHPQVADRRRPGRAEVLRGPAGHRRGRPGADRPDGLHGRKAGRLRAVRGPVRRREAVAGADGRGRARRARPLRPLLPRHAAPGGGHAAVRA